jgi:hypothetical protein
MALPLRVGDARRIRRVGHILVNTNENNFSARGFGSRKMPFKSRDFELDPSAVMLFR